MAKPGDRVGAIRNAEGDTVYLFGYGVYVGEEVPPSNVGGFNVGFPNPRIDLDDGGTVWGCECWWGGEEKIKHQVALYDKVETVKPERDGD